MNMKLIVNEVITGNVPAEFENDDVADANVRYAVMTKVTLAPQNENQKDRLLPQQDDIIISYQGHPQHRVGDILSATFAPFHENL